MMRPEAGQLRSRLDLLVRGMTRLPHDGGYDEPDLDGTAGDCISFDSWEWPRGVELHDLTRFRLRHRDVALRAPVADLR